MNSFSKKMIHNSLQALWDQDLDVMAPWITSMALRHPDTQSEEVRQVNHMDP